MITKDELKQARELCEKAKPGPWYERECAVYPEDKENEI